MSENETELRKLPFNNLFLNAGVVHGRNQWWIYVLGVVAVIFGYVLFQNIFSIPLITMAVKNGHSIDEIISNPSLIFNPEITGINKNIFLMLEFGMFISALFFLYLTVKRIHRKPFISIITAYQKIRFKRYFFAFFVWGSLTALSTVIPLLFSTEGVTVQFNPGNFFILLLVLIAFVPFQTALEELLFRGYLVQGLSQVFRNGWLPVIITSLMFGLLHMDNPEAKTYGWQLMLPYYTSFGLFLGFLTLLDEGLELALGIHCANNIVSGLLVTSPNSVLKTDAIFLVQAENPIGEILLWAFLAALTFIIFWLKYRWKSFNLMLK